MKRKIKTERQLLVKACDLTNSNKNGILLGDDRRADFLLLKTKAHSRFGELNRSPIINRIAPFLLEGNMFQRNNGKVKIKCLICSKDFFRSVSKKAKYCSHLCYYKSRIGVIRSEKTREAIKKGSIGKRMSVIARAKISYSLLGLRGKDSRHWQGGRRKEWTGYIRLYNEDYPGRKVLEHRYVMEQFLKRKLEKDELIHHINGVKDDNRMENLLLCKDRAEHNYMHKEMEEFMFKLIQKGRIIYDKEKELFKEA